MKKTTFYIALFCFAIASAAAMGETVLKGPAFFDPSTVQEMPAEWVKKPISHDPAVGKADIVVTLDQNQYTPLLKEVEQYAAVNRLKIAVKEGTCGISEGELARKAIDIGGFCCPAGAGDRLPGLRFHTVGVVPLAILVNAGNTVEGVSLADVRRIFQGEIYNWSQLKDSKGRSGPDLRILVIGRLHCKLRPGHWRLLLDNEDLYSPRMQEVGTIPDVLSRVASSPGAIGFEVMFFAEKYGQAAKVKALSIDGYRPDAANMLGGKYPFYNTLNVTTWEGPGVENPNARKLVQYLLGRMEQIDKKFGIVPASGLRKAGWKFKGDELIGEPE